MTLTELNGIWNYFLSLEADMSATSRFIEPKGQENVYSFEFAKLIVLSCTEIEAVFKMLCNSISGQEGGNIGQYKETILSKYPKIIDAEVYVSRLEEVIRPFQDWNKGKLVWWDAYGDIKHNRKENFYKATYQNAIIALSALYVLIFYLAKIEGQEFDGTKSSYIVSAYMPRLFACAPDKELPDFEKDKSIPKQEVVAYINRKPQIHIGTEKPDKPKDGDIFFQVEKN